MKHQQPNLLFIDATSFTDATGTAKAPRYRVAAGRAPEHPETAGDEGPQ